MAPTAKNHNELRATTAIALLSFGFVGISLTGCQVDVGGQTLPSAYYLQDDIQYFPAGPEFKLAKEAAAQKAYKKELAENDTCKTCK
jgi:hypothetical protein